MKPAEHPSSWRNGTHLKISSEIGKIECPAVHVWPVTRDCRPWCKRSELVLCPASYQFATRAAMVSYRKFASRAVGLLRAESGYYLCQTKGRFLPERRHKQQTVLGSLVRSPHDSQRQALNVLPSKHPSNHFPLAGRTKPVSVKGQRKA